jgi:predicted alpha/beta superfamily hydrolase
MGAMSKAATMKTAKTASPAPIPAALRGSVQFDMASEISGRTYRVFIFKPQADPPPSGYPVVFVTDANMTFPIAATISATYLMLGGGALVVGIGYPAEDPLTPMLMRTRDLTPPTPLSGILKNPGMPEPKAEDYSGADAFYGFLTDELRPAIAADYAVDPANQTLYGHSLGGLFVLDTLFKHPQAFRNFAASSPSIWWNSRALLEGEAAFTAKVRAKSIAPRVLIMIGAREQEMPAAPMPNMTRAQTRKLLDLARMVDNATELAERLGRLRGGPDYLIRFANFTDEDHMSVVAASLSRTLAFALRGEPKKGRAK